MFAPCSLGSGHTGVNANGLDAAPPAGYTGLTMRKLIIVGVLLSTLPGCPKPPRPAHPPVHNARYVPLKLPKRVAQGGYRHWRHMLSSMALSHPQRHALQRLLRDYLIAEAHEALTQNRGDQAMEHFLAAAALHDPTEVYAAEAKDPALRKLAAAVNARFGRQGDTAKVLPALAVLLSLSPKAEAATLERTLRQVIDWQEGTLIAMHGRGIRGHRVIPALEKAAAAWPSKQLLATLYRLYVEQKAALRQLGPLRGLVGRQHPFFFPVVRRIGYNITRRYLLVDKPYLALQKLRELEDTDGNATLRGLLERAVAPSASADDQIRLAEEFEERDADVALRICRRAAERFAKTPRAHACVGRLAARTNNALLAVQAYEEALRLQPADVQLATALAKEYERRIFIAVDLERLDQARKYLGQLAAFHRKTEAQLGQALKLGLGRVYYAVGYGFYNAGKIEDAKLALSISLKQEPLPQTLYQLAQIELKSGHPTEAVAYLMRLTAHNLPSPAERLYWKGKADLALGGAYRTLNKAALSKQHYGLAERVWRHWSSLGLKPESRAEAHIHQARALFGLGEQARALEALENAIDAAPSRRNTYTEVISLLVLQGHLPEALDAYYRAIGRTEVTEYHKAYCSMWVIGLARRAGQGPPPLALNYLRMLRGSRWYHRLALLTLGKTSYEALRKEALSAGKLAELDFYQAENALAAGKPLEAAKLWRSVLASKMMAFFEYEMAQHNLEQGPAKVSVLPVDRQASSAARDQGSP